MELPLGLVTALETDNCVLFVGAGIGNYLIDSDGLPAPDGKQLADDLIEEFSLDIALTPSLSKVAKIVELRLGRKELDRYLQKRFSRLNPNDSLIFLSKLRWKAIFTTNYDDGIEKAYGLNSHPKQIPFSVSYASNMRDYDIRFEIPIIHLHGSLFGDVEPNVIVTDDDFAKFRERRRLLFNLLKVKLATSTFIYIGYSNTDPNWSIMLQELLTDFYPSIPPRSYRIAPFTDAIDKEILLSKGIETIDGTLDDFNTEINLAINTNDITADKLAQIRVKLPEELVEIFEKDPAAVIRFVRSWDFVNYAEFTQNPNLDAFLKGDKCNWGLIERGLYFERDIETEIYDQLLDYLTSSTKNPHVLTILGPAGYGTSTLLRILAVKLVREKAGTVFFLKPNAKVLEGDVEFGASLFTSPIFFIDNAADNSEGVFSVTQLLRSYKKSGILVLGERLNEWRQAHGKNVSREFIIENLSDNEINKVLDFLDENHRLNFLADLSRDQQFSIIKKKHNKELLVAMREATEGKDFDAIIEDEYRGIGNSLAQKIYLVICCLHQHDVQVRDRLLADLSNCTITDLYDALAESAEGVVVYNTDEYEETTLRARHRIIASIVWEKCSTFDEKEELLIRVIENLNPNYHLDEVAFENIIRSDRTIDSIRSFEGRTKFFEIACQKEPLSPYVRQHYARMLIRSNYPDSALGQIEAALKINPRLRVLYHTKGQILSDLAIQGENVEICRRRLHQSEQCYQQGLNIDVKDEYCYQGLAQLYRKWAIKIEDEKEQTQYLSKAEEAIEEGLKHARVRDGLWIESSNIQYLLGDQPSRVKALENAVQENPMGYIARFLLGRVYRFNCEFQKAINILELVIQNYHDEFRSFLEYAICLREVKQSYKEPIAILRTSTLYGFSDSKYIATLGGFLFMDGQYSDAHDVFSETTKHQFTNSELNTIHYRPIDPDHKSCIRLNGKIITVKGSYSFVEVPGYGPVFLPGSLYNGIFPKEGMLISFDIGFTAKGPIAENISII